MKIGIISTINTNIGDDFIRDGLLYVLSRLDPNLSVLLVNKHEPNRIYPGNHPVNWPNPFRGRLRRYYTRSVDALTYRLGGSAFDSCDAIIQSGAPVYFHDCARMEWSKMIWEHVVCRLAPNIPVLNLAAGSCYPWERIPDEIIEARDKCFVERISAACRLTTVRDSLAQSLLRKLGFEVSLIPCSAILAAKKYLIPRNSQKYIFVNYMQRGTHFDFDQRIDSHAWADTMRKFVNSVKARHPVAFICHSQEEYHQAVELDATVPRFWPQTVAEYLEVAAMGMAGVFNRMHAAVGFAGLGIPSIGIGGDTRMLMVEALGLKTLFVKDVTVEMLEESLESLLHMRTSEQERLLSLQASALSRYCDGLRRALSL